MEKLRTIIITVCIVSILSFYIYQINKRHTTLKQYAFNGVVNDIKYEEKGAVWITVNGRKYLLNFDTRNNVKPGDSIIKQKDQMQSLIFNVKEKLILFCKSSPLIYPSIQRTVHRGVLALSII